MRIDKWLWAARFYKTRQLAIDEINKGRIKVNNEVIKPARILKIDDNITLKKNGYDIYNIKVISMLPTRLNATLAKTMYIESEESIEKRIQTALLRKLSMTPKPEHKPNKSDRKTLINIKKQG